MVAGGRDFWARHPAEGVAPAFGRFAELTVICS